MNKTLLNNIALGVAAIIIAPKVIGVVMKATVAGSKVINDGISDMKYHSEMRKAIKEGTVVKIKGKYYIVEEIIESPPEV